MIKSTLAIALTLGIGAVQAEDLKTIYNQALESDPQLRAAQYAFTAAGEARNQSRSALLPQINLSANLANNDSEILAPAASASTKSYDSNGYSLRLSQTIYHHDYYVQLKQADAQIVKSQAEYEAARQGLILRAAAAYFDLLSAQDNLAFAEAEKRAISQQLRQTKQRFEVGLSAITDVHEAQAGYDFAVAQEIAARNEVDNAREALREITNNEYTSLSKLTKDIPLVTPDPADIERWVAKAMEQNLPLLAAQAGAEAARREVDRRRAGHYPTLDLVASHSYSDTTDAPVFGNERQDTQLSLQLNLPLYSGGYTSSRSREALAQFNQAQEGVVQTRRSVVRQTREAYLGVTAGISVVKARNQALASAQTALNATQAGFEVGTRTAVDVLNAQREKFRAERDYARARYDYILATLRLKQAAGNLGEPDLDQINGMLD